MTLRMVPRFLLIGLLSLLYLESTVWANENSPEQNQDLFGFEKITIPGTKCGLGGKYAVWIKKGDSQKAAFELMGGGACWDQDTCLGKKQLTLVTLLPAPLPGLITSNMHYVPQYKNSTRVYFPYCTGDVHAGSHTAQYGKLRIYHHGSLNIEKSLDYLVSQGHLNPNSIDEFLLTGSSAGAIGAVAHAPYFEKTFYKAKTKVLIPDAPGLHFGKNFWNKFPEKMISDFQSAFLKVGFYFHPSQSNMAVYIPTICHVLKDFKIGILQASKDIVMSLIFGNISPKEHEELIMSDQGLVEMAKLTSNCSVWVHDSYMHTFLISPIDRVTTIKGFSQLDFVNYLASNSIMRRRTEFVSPSLTRR